MSTFLDVDFTPLKKFLTCLSRSETQKERKITVLTIGKQSERFGQQLAILLPGEKKLIDDCFCH